MTDVLVVEDEPSVRDLLVELLSEEGYSVAAAPDGQAALQLLDEGLQPRLILADVMMPRLTGVELAAAVRARHATDGPAVALMSAYHQWLDDVEGVVAKLPKPFVQQALLGVVERYCAI